MPFGGFSRDAKRFAILALWHEHSGRGVARLAAVRETSDDAVSHRRFEVCVVQNDVRRLAAEFWVTRFTVSAAAFATRMLTDLLLGDVPFDCGSRSKPHMVIVCGGTETTASKATAGWLRNARKTGREIVGLDTAPLILASAGLLEGKTCTMHWEMIPVFEERFGDKAQVSTALYEEDNRIFTCAGRTATLDLMVYLVERHHGEQIASRVCEVMVTERQRGPGETQRIPLQSRHGVTNAKLIRAIERMAENLEEPINLDQVATAAGLSRRRLERLFRRDLGHTPSTFYRMMRLEKAHLLLIRSRTSIVDVAARCGFVSAAHFSKTYRAYYGVPPQESRQVASKTRSGEIENAANMNPAFQRPMASAQRRIDVRRTA